MRSLRSILLEADQANGHRLDEQLPPRIRNPQGHSRARVQLVACTIVIALGLWIWHAWSNPPIKTTTAVLAGKIATVTVTNTTGDPKDVFCSSSAYDAGGGLVGADGRTLSFAASGSETFQFPAPGAVRVTETCS